MISLALFLLGFRLSLSISGYSGISSISLIFNRLAYGSVSSVLGATGATYVGLGALLKPAAMLLVIWLFGL